MTASGKITSCTSFACFTSSASRRCSRTDSTSRRSSSTVITAADSRSAVWLMVTLTPKGNQVVSKCITTSSEVN